MKTPLRLGAILLLAVTALLKMKGFSQTYRPPLDSAFSSLSSKTTAYQQHASSPFCQALLARTSSSSPLALWTQYLEPIHQASRLPPDKDYEFSELTAQLLHLISPRLPHSVKALPRDFSSLQFILEHVLWPRYQFLLQKHNSTSRNKIDPPRPVKMVVLGGSVVSGVNCLQIFENKVQHKLTRQQCAWPYRWQQFLHQMTAQLLGEEVSIQEDRLLFEVHTVAMGGSNTITGNYLLEFDLLPPEAKNPDIIIHAYATNDMHINSLHQGQSYGNNNGNDNSQSGSWREKILTVLQDFIRLAYSTSRPSCSTTHNSNSQSTKTTQNPSDPPQAIQQPPPLVLHLDDYLGNEQRQILATTELSQAVQVLANYYGTIAAASYADVVRDWVYGDTHESWFSPRGWYYGSNINMKREIHPGMPMHMVVPWILSYNLLNLVVTYCDRQPYAHEDSYSNSGHHPHHSERTPFESIPRSHKIMDDEYNVARTHFQLPLPPLQHQVQKFPGKPRVTPYGLPPKLDVHLSLQDISDRWRNDTIIEEEHLQTHQCVTKQQEHEEPKCPLAWVSGLLNQHNALDEAGVEQYFQQHAMAATYSNDGWEVKRHVDGKKMGWVPNRVGANWTMVLQQPPTSVSTIRQVVMFYLKSYGERWDQSRLRLQLHRQHHPKQQSSASSTSAWELLMARHLEGFHDKNTSEMYIERLILPKPIQPNDRLRLEATFLQGKVFKIMGLLVCQ